MTVVAGRWSRIAITILTLLISLPAMAGEEEDISLPDVAGEQKEKPRIVSPHSVSFIVADAIWESVIYHDKVMIDYTFGNPNFTYTDKNNYRHSPHFTLEYAYRLKPWFEVGVQTNFQLTTWDLIETTGNRVESTRNCFYNLSFIPEARFVYLHKKWVEMHSGLGFGMDINGGSEVFPHKGHSVNTWALDLNYVGVAVGQGHWYGTFDLGGTFAMLGTSSIFMLSSRIFRLGVTYRF